MGIKSEKVSVLAALMVVASGCAIEGRVSAGSRGASLARAPQASVFEGDGWTQDTRSRCRDLEPLIAAHAVRIGQDPALVMGIAWVESRFRSDAVSSAGAVGLLQVMPSNGERLACGPLDEAEPNLSCGLEVLRRFLKHYDGDVILALSAYNAGYRMPNKARTDGTLPANMRYVEKVLAARSHYLRVGCSP